MYLDQFKRGWSYTAVYLLRDRVDEGGNQKFGFYTPGYAPRKAAIYLHNLTTILNETNSMATTTGQPNPSTLDYSIPNEPATIHDLLLQNSGGTFQVIVWGEQVNGSSAVTVQLGNNHAAVSIYDPTIGTKAVHALANVSSVPLTLSDHPLILTFN
jgi:hypothetical protein